MNRYYIGVDAGGTKTTATAYNEQGEPLLTKVGGFGNVTVNMSQGLNNIINTINEIIQELGDGAEIAVGIAGVETGNKKAMVQEELLKHYSNVFVTNDAYLGLYAALKGQDGILIISGTGSIGYLKRGDDMKRFGGWGHLINDDGSGYSIAIKAIRYIAYSFDTNNSDTALKNAIFTHLDITYLKQLIDFTYKSSKGEIASLAAVVSKTAEEGDYQAQSILSWAGERLAYLAIGLCSQYNILNPRIALSGSIIRNVELTKRTFCDTLNSELAGYTLMDEDFEPQIGGYYLLKSTEK